MYNPIVPSYTNTPEINIFEYLEPECSTYFDTPYLDELEYRFGSDTSKGAEECVHMLVEELYESASFIDEKRIDAAMYTLAKWAGLKLERLDGGLNIKHGSGRRELIDFHSGYSRALIDMNVMKKRGV